jgi:hypothetical protein
VTLSENVVERAVGTRTLEARRTTVASGRACARGKTTEAARSAALTDAYKDALVAARARAGAGAAQTLRSLVAMQLAVLRAAARRQISARARLTAIAARRALAKRALAQAAARPR